MADANLPAPPAGSTALPTGHKLLDFSTIPGHRKVETSTAEELNFDTIPGHRAVRPETNSKPSAKGVLEDLISRVVEEFQKLSPEEQERSRQNIRDGIAALDYPDGRPGVPPGE